MRNATNTLKLNTKQDFRNNYEVRVANNEVDPLVDYRFLLSNVNNWFNQTVSEEQTVIDPITNEEVIINVDVPVIVESVDAGVTDDTHRVIEMDEGGFVQQLYRYDPNCLAALKGFTVEELEGILGL